MGQLEQNQRHQIRVNNVIVEEEHKLSHRSSSMNESEFDNMSSDYSSVSENATELMSNKEIQRTTIIKQIQAQKEKSAKKEEEKKKDMERRKSRNVLRVESGTLDELVNIRKSNKNIDGIRDLPESTQPKPQLKDSESSLNEEAFDNMSDSVSSAEEEDDLDREDIEKQIKLRINLNKT